MPKIRCALLEISILQCAQNPHAGVSLLTLGTAPSNFLKAELYKEKQRSSTELLKTKKPSKTGSGLNMVHASCMCSLPITPLNTSVSSTLLNGLLNEGVVLVYAILLK